MTCGSSCAPSPPATPSPCKFAAPASPGAASKTEAQSSAAALRRQLQQETPEELALVRRGEASAVARINHLKNKVATHERNAALLTASLAAQHELLADVAARVDEVVRAAQLARPTSSPRELKEHDPHWEAVIGAVHQLQQRLQRGSSTTPLRSPGSSNRPARPFIAPSVPVSHYATTASKPCCSVGVRSSPAATKS